MSSGNFFLPITSVSHTCCVGGAGLAVPLWRILGPAKSIECSTALWLKRNTKGNVCSAPNGFIPHSGDHGGWSLELHSLKVTWGHGTSQEWSNITSSLHEYHQYEWLYHSYPLNSSSIHISFICHHDITLRIDYESDDRLIWSQRQQPRLIVPWCLTYKIIQVCIHIWRCS